jgi:hypothetical protein
VATKPGYVWSGTEWVSIGQEAIVNPFYYQATAPTSPSTGDIWIESDVDVPSVDSAQFLRWRKTMTGGQTSLSGNDDSSLPLGYTPGYEQLYINGVLMVRGVDYTATTGTTVTGLTALTVNDVVEVFSTLARTVADVYTQTQIDSKLASAGWTEFTPTYSNLTLGTTNLINVGRYALIGKTAFVQIYTFLGTGGSASGNILWNPPAAILPKRDVMRAGLITSLNFQCSAGGVAGAGFCTLDSTDAFRTTVLNAAGTYAALTNTSATIPGTWAANSQIIITGSYEVA